MKLKNFVVTGIIAITFGMTSAATAASITFSPSDAGSSVNLTETFYECYDGFFGTGDCTVTASIASDTWADFTVEEGNSAEIDFLTFSTNGGFLDSGIVAYDIVATLGFLDPLFSVTGTGSGFPEGLGGALLTGTILGGSLFWDSPFSNITLADGSVVNVAFEDGITILDGTSVTTSATVSVVSVAAVPLPASALLLLGGFGAFGALRRKRKAA